jgi:hypothetical protein
MSLRDVVDTWSSLYSNSAALRSVIGFAHVGGLVSGGGCAIAADLGTLKALGRGPEILRLELRRLYDTHWIVVTSLVIVIVSGVLLTLADLDAYLAASAFWIKMGLVVGLLINGAALVKLTARVTHADRTAFFPLRLVTVTSVVLWLLTTLLGAVLPNAL